MNEKNNRKEKDGISKRGNRRKFYLPYTNQMEDELIKYISSMDGVSNIRILESNTLLSHKCLVFRINNLKFELSIYSKMNSYYRFNLEYEFKCRYRHNESPELIWYWYINPYCKCVLSTLLNNP